MVVDQNMPGLSGIELITKLRAHDISAPAILITTHPDRSLKSRAAQANVPIVEKPLLGNVLIDKIRDVCGQHPATPNPDSQHRDLR